MLKAEMDAKLGYHKNDPAPKGTENRRNGSYPKTVRSGMSRILCKRQIETISNIVDLVQPRVTEWQTRKLDRGKERNASIKA